MCGAPERPRKCCGSGEVEIAEGKFPTPPGRYVHIGHSVPQLLLHRLALIMSCLLSPFMVWPCCTMCLGLCHFSQAGGAIEAPCLEPTWPNHCRGGPPRKPPWELSAEGRLSLTGGHKGWGTLWPSRLEQNASEKRGSTTAGGRLPLVGPD